MNLSDLIGVKYTLHGRSKEEGFDCYGLVLEVEKRYGYNLPDFQYKDSQENMYKSNVAQFLNNKKIIKVDELFEGAAILFKNCADMNDHIGVYIGNNNFIHCNKYGVHVESIKDYENKISGIYAVLC